MFEATPLGGWWERIADIILMFAILAFLGFLAGIFIGSASVGYNLMLRLAGF